MINFNSNDYFVELPNEVVFNYKEDVCSLIGLNGHKFAMIMTEIAFTRNILDECRFTLESLIVDLGYTPKTGKGKINEQFKNVLCSLEELGYIYDNNIPMKDVTANTFIRCKIKNNTSEDENGCFKVFYRDYIKIINLDFNCKKDVLLCVYFYILSKMNYKKYNDNIKFSYLSATEDLGITGATLRENVNILLEHKLISMENFNLIKENTEDDNYGVRYKSCENILNTFVRGYLTPWKESCKQKDGNRCVLTGAKDNIEIHHQYLLDNIIRDSLDELNLDLKEIYSREEANLIRDKVIELHNKHRLGVCLNKSLHTLFHIKYGKKDCGETEFDEFTENYFRGMYDNELEDRLKSSSSSRSLDEAKKLASF